MSRQESSVYPESVQEQGTRKSPLTNRSTLESLELLGYSMLLLIRDCEYVHIFSICSFDQF
jgi:hypothetical protein